MTINGLVRREVQELESYSVPELPVDIKMDANENNWGLPEALRDRVKTGVGDFPFHRYPDSDSSTLRERLGRYTGMDAGNLMVGNGSDELIMYVVNTFVSKGDRIVIHTPTFSMYDFFTRLSGGQTVAVESDGDFRVDSDSIVKAALEQEAKIVFVSNPNNPTGTVLSETELERIISGVRSVVVVDEAYYDFYGETVINWVYEHSNLIVLRTFSKALALAGLRIGYLAAGDEIMEYLKRVKIPYNVSSFSQYMAGMVMDEEKALREWLEEFRQVREDFASELASIDGVKVFPSHANFVLISVPDGEGTWRKLLNKGILVRKFGDRKMKDCLRVTIGKPGENRVFLRELAKCLKEG